MQINIPTPTMKQVTAAANVVNAVGTIVAALWFVGAFGKAVRDQYRALRKKETA